MPGLRATPWPEFPKVPGAWVTKTDVLNHCVGLRWSLGRIGFESTFGRGADEPVFEMSDASMMVSGRPVRSDSTPLVTQPPKTALVKRDALPRKCLPFPNGSS